jgi:rod shape-determining protein MreC
MGNDKARSRFFLSALLITSLLLITLDLRGNLPSEGIRKVSAKVSSPFQTLFNSIYRPISTFTGDVFSLGRTRGKISNLQKENAALKEELSRKNAITNEVKDLKSVMDLAGAGRYKIVPARIIAVGSAASFSRTIQLDVGKADGIKKDMSIIAGGGLVARILSVSENSAIALLMDDETFKVGVRLESTGTLGVVSGTGGNDLELILLDSTSDLRVGQRIVARGSSNSQPFLPGVPVGVITEVNQTAGALTKSAVVKPFVDLNRISVVAVIVSKSRTNPRDALLPAPPKPTPIPTVTVFVTPTPVLDQTPSSSDVKQ